MKLLNYFPLALLASFLLTSCGSNYLDINENPNAATTPPIDGLLANASTETALNQFRVANGHTVNFTQYIASPNISNTTDIFLDVSNGGAWSSLYDTMTDLYDLIRFGEAQEAEGHVGIAKVLMAINLGLVADNWGAAPYSDAFTGLTITPQYDSAEELYATIFGLLDEAEATLSNYDGTPGIRAGADFLYGATDGDSVAPWLRAISSLRARYLNHLSETDRYNPSEVLTAVDAGFTSSDDNLSLDVFEVRNPWAQVALNNENLFLGGWLSSYFVSALNGDIYGTFDPRLPLLTDTTATGDYRGTPNGAGRQSDGAGDASESYLERGRGPAADDAPLDIITFAELKFIEAEAALAAGNDDRASSAFRTGIRAHMSTVGVDSASAEAYILEEYGDDGVSIDEIFREKYVALFLSPETWVDARRYDYQYEGIELPQGAVLDQFPTSLIYPNTEIDRNRENVPLDREMLDRIFWDR